MRKNLLLIIGLLFLITANAAYQPKYSTAGFYSLDGTGRQAYSMNMAWRFKKSDVANAEAKNFDDSKWEVVSIPHGLEYIPADASGCVNYQGPAWYRKHFTPDESMRGKKLFLHFEAIMGKCKVWVNGELVNEHFGGYLPVISDISKNLKWGEDNVIAVKTDNSDDPLYPPGKPQNLLDFAYFGGIYRDCWLIVHNNVFITDPNYEKEVAGGGLFVSFDKVSTVETSIILKTQLRNEDQNKFTGMLEYELLDKNDIRVAQLYQKVKIEAGTASSNQTKWIVKNVNLWSPQSPYLYRVNVRVLNAKGKVIDGYQRRIGIRSIEFKQKDGLWLNGKPYNKPLIGANRHQDFAIVGNALPNSTHWRDAKKLRDAGLEIIRNAHYPQDPAFMDACDELGLFVIVTTPGWQFWNKSNSIFGERVLSDIAQMIRRDRNHPSVFMWEPILNETSYPASFAKDALEVTKKESPYPNFISGCDDGADGAEYFQMLLRPRNKLDSTKTYFVREWGDNVDDWNSHNSNSRVSRAWGEVPMLIQAVHYAQPSYNYLSLDSLYRNPRQIVGGCLWHSFDHQRGYHPTPFYGGIMDAFRQPKFSYYLFKAQRDKIKSDIIAETGPMVYIAHEMTPFSPKDVTVYSNCDEVRLTFLKDGQQKVYKKDPKHKGIPSPIITFSNMFDFMMCKAKAKVKKQDEVYLLAEGLIDGKVVGTHKVMPSLRPNKVMLWLDNEGVELVANGSDIVTVVAGIADNDGNIKRLSNDFVRFGIEGEGRILGGNDVMQNPCPVLGGTAPILVQSTTKSGKIKITASVLFEGLQTPISGELIINSIENKIPALFSSKELDILGKQSIQAVEKTYSKSDLEIENEKLRNELNSLKVKEVEKQQTKFGIGIN